MSNNICGTNFPTLLFNFKNLMETLFFQEYLLFLRLLSPFVTKIYLHSSLFFLSLSPCNIYDFLLYSRVLICPSPVGNRRLLFNNTKFKEFFFHSIKSLTSRCIPQDLRGSRACRTCPAACTAGWSLLCWETVAAER